MVKTKELEIPKKFMEPEWQTNKIKIRRWNLNIRNEIIDAVTEVRPSAVRGQQIQIEKAGQSQILVICKCVTEAPWQPGNPAVTGDLDPEISDWLYEEIQDFNGGDIKNSKGLDESSKEKPQEQKVIGNA